MSLYGDFKFVIELDLDNSGAFATDISNYLLGIPMIQEGRRSLLDAFGPPSVSLDLDNNDSRFSPRNTGSPYSPNFKRWKPIRVRAQMTNLAAVTNLDDNPSAETDIVGWLATLGASRVLDTATAYFGKQCVKYTVTDAASVGCMKQQRDGNRFPVTAINTYTWAPRVKGPLGKNMKLFISWRNAGGGAVGSSEQAFIFGSGWQRSVITAVAPATAVTAWLYVLTDGAQGVFDFWVDGSFFYEGTTEEPYCDGSQPGCSWSGTAHESTSSRPVNPYFGYVIGRIGGIKLRRTEGQGICLLQIQAETFAWGRKAINLAYISGKKGHLAIQRALDRVEGDVGILESAFNDYGAEEALWATFGPVTGGGDDPDPAFEGPREQRIAYLSTGTGGRRRTVTPITENQTAYDLAVHTRLISGPLNGQLRLRISDQSGPISGASFTVPAAYTERHELNNVQWPVTSTTRYVEIVNTVDEALGHEIAFDAWHLQERALRIQRRMDGISFDIDFAAAYQRSARAVLNELAASAGGWLREEIDDSPATVARIVFEDINNRAASPIPAIRLTDADDGMPFDAAAPDESPSDNYSIFRVGSLGAITRGGNRLFVEKKEMWRLEPASIPFGAVEAKRIYMSPYTLAGAKVGTPDVTFDAGGYSFLGWTCYSLGGFVDVTKDATPGNLTSLKVAGISIERSTERTFTEVDKRPDADIEPARIMELDMLGQGRLTQAMSDVRDFFADRYYHGLPAVEVDMSVGNAEQLLAALGLSLGQPVRIIHGTGQGNFALDHNYYLEGRKIEAQTAELLGVTFFLSPT